MSKKSSNMKQLGLKTGIKTSKKRKIINKFTTCKIKKNNNNIMKIIVLWLKPKVESIEQRIKILYKKKRASIMIKIEIRIY